MTPQEAKEKSKSIIIAEIDRLPYHYDEEVDYYVYDDTSKVNELLQLNKIVSKALEKANKYRWHDLRKNPDDLPEADEYGCSEYVLIMIGTPEWDNHEWAYYNYNTKGWSTPFYEQNVFAWRYIEPFKEEQQNEMYNMSLCNLG